MLDVIELITIGRLSINHGCYMGKPSYGGDIGIKVLFMSMGLH